MAKIPYSIGNYTFFLEVSSETHAKLVKAAKIFYEAIGPDPVVKAARKLYGEISEDLLIKFLKEELNFW